MDNVVTINNEAFWQEGEPVPEIVEILEEALSQAKAGKLTALSVSMVDASGFVNCKTFWVKHRYSLVGIMAVAQHEAVTLL